MNEETVQTLHKNTIQYLHDIAEKTPTTLSVLKSYYAAKFRISELQTKITLQKSKNKSDAKCPHCCLKLRQTNSTYAVKPEIKKTKFAQKVLKKEQAVKSLTKFQRQYLKKNKFVEGNQLVVTCNFCKKKVSFKCSKPKKVRMDVNANNSKPNKKVKKKKKDKTCGLQVDKILNNPISKKNEKKKEKNNLRKLSNLLNEKSSSKPSQKKHLAQFLQFLNQ